MHGATIKKKNILFQCSMGQFTWRRLSSYRCRQHEFATKALCNTRYFYV